MRRTLAARFCFILIFALCFSSLPVQFVRASSIQNDSSPIFGLTPDQVIDKYNSLTDSQKSEVRSALGNSTIFSNSLFGNVISTSFGLVNDAIDKIGDLFFQANGVVYHLGSSALSWVYRLIDKVFNDDFQDLNIDQNVVNDFYLNTKDLTYTGGYYFLNGHKPSLYNSYYDSYFHLVFPLPYSNITYLNWEVYDGLVSFPSSNSLSLSSGIFNGLVVNRITNNIYINQISYGYNGSYNTYFSEYLSPGNDKHVFIYPLTCYLNQPYYDGSNWHTLNKSLGGLILGTFSDDYFPSLFNVLDKYFCSIDYYLVINPDLTIELHDIPHVPQSMNVTNNTYYNYIYNIPDMTPLDVPSIVSNTSIYYNPVENIANYLPDDYNIEQNFTVVNNYYISSGSSITEGETRLTSIAPTVVIEEPEEM